MRLFPVGGFPLTSRVSTKVTRAILARQAHRSGVCLFITPDSREILVGFAIQLALNIQ